MVYRSDLSYKQIALLSNGVTLPHRLRCSISMGTIVGQIGDEIRERVSRIFAIIQGVAEESKMATSRGDALVLFNPLLSVLLA